MQETSGSVATWNGKLIEALYSSTTGGFTANDQDVYNSAPVLCRRGKSSRSTSPSAPAEGIGLERRNKL